jgi:outer membrane protein
VRIFLSLSGLFLWASATWADSDVPRGIATIDLQECVLRTQEGQKQWQGIVATYRPIQASLEELQRDVGQLRDRLRNQAALLSEQQQTALAAELAQKTKDLERKGEDAEADFQRDQSRLFNEIGGRMLAVIQEYAARRKYALVLDSSPAQSALVHVADAVDIGNDIVSEYDRRHPSGSALQAPAAKP